MCRNDDASYYLVPLHQEWEGVCRVTYKWVPRMVARAAHG